MADPKLFQFDLRTSERPNSISLREEWYPGIQAAALRTSSSRIYDSILGVRAIVIHATAGSSSAGAASVIVDGNASFHWLVPDEDEQQHGQFVWATCHEARAAWHVRNGAYHADVWSGAKKINHFSLGVEIVNRHDYSTWQVEATAKIVRYCWAKYPNLRHVVSHAKLDPTRRSDPGNLFPWSDFQAKVRNGINDPVAALVAAAHPPNAKELGNLACCMDV